MREKDWHAISRFESHDLVKSWYKKTHESDPGDAKTSQINALFTQGKEYFRNASLADMSVKPLLLYYGVLSLSRGAILLRDPSKKEESLKPGHGLKPVRWQETLKGGIRNVLGLKIKAANGTFRELVSACPNKHQDDCYMGSNRTKTHIHLDIGEIKFANDDSLLSLDDLVSRLPQVKFDYPGITNRKANWFPAIVTVQNNETHFVLLEPSAVIDLQELVDGETVLIQETLEHLKYHPRHSFDEYSLVIRHDARNSYRNELPMFHYEDNAAFMTVILDFPNKDRISEFFKLYLTSFILGTLARYYPSRWIALLRNAPGDFAQPLLLQVIEAIEVGFPAELLLQVPQHPFTLGGAGQNAIGTPSM